MRVKNLVAARENKNSVESSAADKRFVEEAGKAVMEEDNVDMIEEMSETYRKEFRVITKQYAVAERGFFASNITQTMGSAFSEKVVYRITNE